MPWIRALWRWLWHDSADRVSVKWLTDTDRYLETRGVDAVSPKWPLNKIVNEHAGFNTQRLKRRA